MTWMGLWRMTSRWATMIKKSSDGIHDGYALYPGRLILTHGRALRNWHWPSILRVLLIR